jgi:tRNA pseudouridine(38-40) synthase
VDALVDRVNAALPYDVRVFGFRFTTNRFRCKEQCEARTYEMRVPTFVLLTPTPHENDTAAFESYRVPPARLDLLRRALKLFEGTHNFHNYTSRRAPTDPSCKRFMRAVDVLEPAVVAGIEFFTVRLIGQSFMLHQIRKMIGTAVMLVRYEMPVVCIKRTLTLEKFSLPLIPGVGLAVVRCWFTGYDKKIAAGFEGFGKRDQLVWEAEQPLMDAYLRDVIVPHVAALERGDYQEERRRQRQLWAEHLAATAATAPVEAAAVVDVDAGDEDDDAVAGDDDAGDDDDNKQPKAVTTSAASAAALMRVEDKPSKVRPSRKHPFKHWCIIVDTYPPDRASYFLHAALRPIRSIAVVGDASSLAQPLDASTASLALVIYFNADVVRVGETDRYAAGPVRASGTVQIGGSFVNRTLDIGVARNSTDAQPSLPLARIAPQAAASRVELTHEFASDAASLVPYEVINLIGRHLLVMDAESGELLARSVIGVARVETFEEMQARVQAAEQQQQQ